MATASSDKSVRLWNLDKPNSQPIVLEDHRDWVRSAVFTVDDEQLLAGINSNTEDKKKNTIHAWPTRIETMSNILCDKVSRNMTEDEWDTHVDDDPELKTEVTCADKKN